MNPGPLWRKAPLVYAHFPGLGATLALGAMLLSIAAALFPMVLSSTQSGYVRGKIENPATTRYQAGIAFRYGDLEFGWRVSKEDPTLRYRWIGTRFEEVAAQSPLLDSVVHSVLGPRVSVSPEGGGATSAEGRIFAGTGVLEHVEIVAGSEGPGVWLPDGMAAALGVGPGDVVQLLADDPRHAQTSVVDGIYRGLSHQPPRDYWLAWSTDIYPVVGTCPEAECPTPPPFVLTELPNVIELTQALGVQLATFGWQAPLLDATFSTEEARSFVDFYKAFLDEASHDTTEMGGVFLCCQRRFPATAMTSAMPHLVAESQVRVDTLSAPGRVLRVAGAAVALGVLAACAMFAARARRVELDLLNAQGWRPSATALKASVEAIVPCLAGAALGFGASIGLARVLGSGGEVGTEALRASVQLAIGAAFAAPIAIGVVTWLAYRRASRSAVATGGWLWRVPWEVVLIALAGFSYLRLRTGGALVAEPSGVMRPSLLLLAFPILFLSGVGVAGGRLVVLAIRAISARSDGLRPPSFLAAHRLAGAGRLTGILVAATAVCVGTALQSQAMVRSIDLTVDAKARVFVGSDVSGLVDPSTQVPEDFPLPVTVVHRVPSAGTLNGAETRFDMIVIDPASFLSAAYWSPALSGTPIEELVAGLRSSGSGLAVVAAGPTGTVTSVTVGTTRMPIRVVEQAIAFPGMLSQNPTIVVSEHALETALGGATNPAGEARSRTELWVKGPDREAVTALNALPSPPYSIQVANEIKNIPAFAAAKDTFAMLNGLGVVAGLLLAGGILMYLQARARSQVVSYGLSLRMGMSESGHRRSTLLELTIMLAAACGIGALLGLSAARTVMPSVDPIEAILPGPLFVAPVGGVLAAFIAAAFLAWSGARVATWRARSADLAEVMRSAR